MIYTYQDGVKIPVELHGKITILYCSGTTIAEIPATLVNLTILDCSHTDVAEIPATLVNLDILYCSGTKITEIPDTLVNLDILYCAHTPMPNYRPNYQRSGWDVLRFGSMLKIGCEIHSISDWEQFTDEEIDRMDSNALKFWKEHKTHLLSENLL